ncbi:chemokine-like receptor 1 [Colossoma macropomum]|uniref:chemokine-like receptor 1 n=1 Tax=Colossoma macropomum TaxID=42526 RepID=UPI0018648F8B|nr:chemokine-like receptor 1 [Colossoma macropomum]
MNSTPVTQTEYADYKNYTTSSSSCRDVMCISYAVANVIICVLSAAGNDLVIWIAGFKVKKSVVTTWYPSLAVSDFIFSCTLPFRVVYGVEKEWFFRRFMCKFSCFMMWLNMYSSIFLLVIISVDCCLCSSELKEQLNRIKSHHEFNPNGRNKERRRFKVKKSVVSTWYLSLAVSDFMFCCTLPFWVVYRVKNKWFFGRFMCKSSSFMRWLNMYSSIFLLVIISVDRCVLVMFPVWAQNKRTKRKASVIVMLAWIIAAALSAPSAVFREIRYDQYNQTSMCRNNYNNTEHYIANKACRFIFLFMVPFMIIIICYIFIIRKLKSNQTVKSKKPVKIMTVLIVTFLICWLPYQTLSLIRLFMPRVRPVHTAYVFSLLLAHANSCLNPFLYAFMGKDIKEQCYALWSKIENAVKEEYDQNTVQVTDTSSSLPRAITLFQFVHHA